MTTKTAYQCNDQGVYLGETVVQEDPMAPGEYLLPPGCTLIAPPAISTGQQGVFADGAWTVEAVPQPVTAESAPLTLSQAQSNQLAIIAADFAAAANAPVTDSNGLTWTGGESSALGIYGAVQLAQAGGATTVTLFDASNAPHSMIIAQGIAVAAAIGTAYQAAFAKYQGLKVQINAAAAVPGATAATVQAIAW